MELPFTIVGAVLLGGVLGYFLDRWLHTKLIFTLILGGWVCRRVEGSFAAVGAKRFREKRTSSHQDPQAAKAYFWLCLLARLKPCLDVPL